MNTKEILETLLLQADQGRAHVTHVGTTMDYCGVAEITLNVKVQGHDFEALSNAIQGVKEPVPNMTTKLKKASLNKDRFEFNKKAVL